MHEQLLYELPDIGDASPEVYRSSAHKASGKKPNPKMGATAAYVGGHFLFKFASDEPDYVEGIIPQTPQPIDTTQLSPRLYSYLPYSDFVIVNVATWWPTRSVGAVIDTDLHWIEVDSGPGEWQTLNKNDSGRAVDFGTLMERGLHLIKARLRKGAVLVWRMETLTDCEGSSFRSSIVPVLKRMNIPILNVTEATCAYTQFQPNQTDNIHLCFPSVALRNQLKTFEVQFL